MKNKISIINGLPVEIPLLDEEGEKKRKLLSDLAFEEYKDSGAINSVKLQEANAEFLKDIKKHLME